MAEITISREEIGELASKLDELGEILTDQERALLIVVFGLAATELANVPSDAESASASAARIEMPMTLPPLSEGFLNAFQPGEAGSFSIPGDEVADSVGGSVGCISWSKDYNMPVADMDDLGGISGGVPGGNPLGG